MSRVMPGLLFDQGGNLLRYVPVNQGAAGTTELLAAQVDGRRHKLLGAFLVLSAAGTIKFTDGAGDLTGPMDWSANAGMVCPTGIIPWTQTVRNSALSLVTTGGAARGVVVVLTEA